LQSLEREISRLRQHSGGQENFLKPITSREFSPRTYTDPDWFTQVQNLDASFEPSFTSEIEAFRRFEDLSSRVSRLQVALEGGDILLSFVDGRPAASEIRGLYEYARELAAMAKDVLRRLGVDLNRTVEVFRGLSVPLYNLEIPTYEEWKRGVLQAARDTRTLIQSGRIGLVQQPPPGIDLRPLIILLKILVFIFGPVIAETLMLFLEKKYFVKLVDLSAAYGEKNWKRFIRVFLDILREVVKDREFWEELLKRLGKGAVKEFIGICMKYLGPFIGWIMAFITLMEILSELINVFEGGD
jgi:hypothetical protein